MMHKLATAKCSLLKNEHPWAQREGKQETTGRKKQEERGGDEEWLCLCVCGEKASFLGHKRGIVLIQEVSDSKRGSSQSVEKLRVCPTDQYSQDPPLCVILK